MTIRLPLQGLSPGPSIPPFVTASKDPPAQLKKVVKAICKARRIVVICGAGISVQAGIPDFRSSEGLFQSLKKDNPVNSGKDLFDASVFNSEQTTLMFCQMIAKLSELSKAAQPTIFHRFLRSLDDSGRLLRVYTQNIDALEVKSGLSFGVPQYADKRQNNQYRPKHKVSVNVGLSVASQEPDHHGSPTRTTSFTSDTPRCIPLHGTLQLLHCPICTHSFPLEDHHGSLTSGVLPQCPECISIETTRQLVGKRARGVGKLRPSVVLYNEAHKDAEGVGEATRRDIMGSSKGKGRNGADVLLVVGTSLRVPGTKRMVREFSKAVHSRASKDGAASQSSSPSPTPGEEEPQFRSIYLNLDFPLPMREWEGVFDVWIQGDAQSFGEMLQQELDRVAKAKELAEERRRRKENQKQAAGQKEDDVFLIQQCPTPPQSTKKRKALMDPAVAPKRQRLTSPPPTPTTSRVQFKGPCSSSSGDDETCHLIPEVVITRPPTTPVKKTPFSRGCAPPTPDKSPPYRFVENTIRPPLSNHDPPWVAHFRVLHLEEPYHRSRLAVSYERTIVK